MKTVSTWIAAGAMTVLLSGAAQAALVIADPFDYGASDIAMLTTSPTALNGGTGLAGTWTLSSQNTNNHATYLGTGLTFGMLLTTGGALRTEGQWSGSSLVSRQLNTTLTGTVWGSFLVKPGAQPLGNPNRSTSVVYFGTKQTGEWASDLGVNSKAWDNAVPVASVKMGQSNGGSALAGTAMTYDGTQTYLALFKATNIGGAGSKTLYAWYLTPDQFTYFTTAGLTEAALNAATLGTANTNVLQRGSNLSSTDCLVDTTRYLNIETALNPAGNTIWNVVYDEIRISNDAVNGLAQVTPLIPEPAAGALLLTALALALRRRR